MAKTRGMTGLFADKLAQESLVSAPVKTALHQRVEHEAVLIDGAPEPVFPEPVFLAVDRDDNLVEIPFFSELRARRRNLSARSRPNFSARRRTVSWLTIIPCAASKSSTILRPDAPSCRLKSSEPRSQSPPKRKIWTAAGRTACSVLHSSGECVRALLDCYRDRSALSASRRFRPSTLRRIGSLVLGFTDRSQALREPGCNRCRRRQFLPRRRRCSSPPRRPRSG